jgi:prepilin-type processing-associated H-X9-DG protein
LNWVANVMDWTLSPDNTNPATITEASLGPYASKSVPIYRCPADHVLSDAQQQAGWTARLRSYSMNAMMGDAGPVSASGSNKNNPYYIQFFSITAVPQPAAMFNFLEEHPDSIDDGYFLDKPGYGGYEQWLDLPASYHNGAANFAFADGHSEIHRWLRPSTIQPARPGGAPLPMDVPPNEGADFQWVIERMSVAQAQ